MCYIVATARNGKYRWEKSMETQFLATYESVVCQALARLREQHEYSQAAFAELVALSPSTWSRIEGGDTGISLDHLKKAADALGMTPAKVLELTDQIIEQTPHLKIVHSKKELLSGMSIGQAAAGVIGVATIPATGLILGGLITAAAVMVSQMMEKNK